MNNFTKSDKDTIKPISKHGITLWAYNTNSPAFGIVDIEVEKGHFEEFYHKTSTFHYHILDGEGIFYLNDKATPVKSGDSITIPPLAKIYYKGRMKMILVTAPAWNAEDEVHVRDIDN